MREIWQDAGGPKKKRHSAVKYKTAMKFVQLKYEPKLLITNEGYDESFDICIICTIKYSKWQRVQVSIHVHLVLLDITANNFDFMCYAKNLLKA